MTSRCEELPRTPRGVAADEALEERERDQTRSVGSIST